MRYAYLIVGFLACTRSPELVGMLCKQRQWAVQVFLEDYHLLEPLSMT